MTTYESIYPGADESLMPKYSGQANVAYQLDIGELGMATDPRTANQLGAVNSALNPGTKNIELGGIQGAVFESIPEPHLEEIRRLMEMAKASPSVHAPIVEASGVSAQQGVFTEEARLGAEQTLKSAVLRSQKIDPKGNISVTVHTTGELPEMESYIKDKDGKKQLTQVWVVNEIDGKVAAIRPKERYFPEEGEKFEGKPQEFKPEKELAKINDEQWTDQLSGINRLADYGEQSINHIKRIFEGGDEEVLKTFLKQDIDKIEDENDRERWKIIQRELNHGHIYLRGAYKDMKSLFDMAYKNASKEDKEKLESYGKEAAAVVKKGIENDPDSLGELRQVVERGLKVLGKIETPEIFKPLNDFAINKSSQTFANVAQAAYKKYQDKAPIINVENPPAGGGLSTADDMIKLIKSSREKLVENLRKDGIGSGQAKQIAEKMLGATWDVGHINMLRKKGWSEKDIVKETEKIAPYVKHVHLSDNFGLDHTELPMGMGNVPIKEMLKKLGQKGFEGKKIIEAGNWWQYFAEHGGGNPLKPTIEAFDSPIYGMEAGPSWSQSGMYGAYYSGLGPTNPPKHHELYGSGFQLLPTELGGEMPGERGRFSGTPNQ